MASVTYISRWNIPEESSRAEFLKEWYEVSKTNKEKYGLVDAVLYHVEPESFIAVTNWPDHESWAKWQEDDSAHPYREKWKPYRVFGPEVMTSVIELRP